MRESYAESRNLAKELGGIESDRGHVMRGGMSHIGRFCLDLVQRAELRRRGEEMPEQPPDLVKRTPAASLKKAESIASHFVNKTTEISQMHQSAK
jgi:hypothetical protein